MSGFSSFLSLWGVTSWLCKDKIRKEAKTNVSNQKRYSLSKLRLNHTFLKCLRWKICITPPKCLCNERRHNFYCRSSIVATAAMLWRRCVFPNMIRGVTRLRYSANHNALDSWPIRTHCAFQNDKLCKNRCVSERRGREEQQ